MMNIPDSYHFGASSSLMITKILKELDETEPVREARSGTLYRGNNYMEGNMVSVFEVFDTPNKQILWIWFRHIDGFEDSELTDIREQRLKDSNTPKIMEASQREMSLEAAGQTSFVLYGSLSGITYGIHENTETKTLFRQIYQAPERGRFCVLEIAYHSENEMTIWKWSHDDKSLIDETNRAILFLPRKTTKYAEAFEK
ncbi:hypothetical protein GGI35DRAFT_477631 [Trichoderma velutinum]